MDLRYALTTVLIVGLFAIAQRAFPAGSMPPAPLSAADEQRLRRWVRLEGPLSLLCAGVFGYGLYIACRFSAEQLNAPPPGAVFHAATSPDAWKVLGGLGGALIGAGVYYAFLSRVLGPLFPGYLALKARQAGFDTWRLLRWLTLLVGPAVGLGIILLMGHTLIVTDRGLLYDAFWSLRSRTYDFTAVTEVANVLKVKAPNGDVFDRPYYVFTFHDGYRFSTRDLPGDGTPVERRRLAEFVAMKAGREIVTRPGP